MARTRRPARPHRTGWHDFMTESRSAGFEVRACSRVHWQVLSPLGRPLVNYWPTTGRFRAERGGETYTGRMMDVIRLAVAAATPSIHPPFITRSPARHDAQVIAPLASGVPSDTWDLTGPI